MDIVSPTVPPHASLGVLFIGLALSSVLYGVTCIQACRYFRLHCTRDSWILRTAVFVVWLLETLNTAFSVRAIEWFAINHRGDYLSLWSVTWMIGVQSSLNTFAGSIIQFFFAWRIFIMSGKNYWFTGFIIIISVCQLAGGLTVTILGLCYYLQKRKTGHDVTNRLVNNLTVMTINNGIMSSGFALMALIALYAWPMSQLPTACCFLHGKAYTNTLFASLNSRLESRDRLATHTFSSSTASGRQLHGMEYSLSQFGTKQWHTVSGDNSDVMVISREPCAEPPTPHFDETMPLQVDGRR
ncbi:hypothetical protein BDQ17DRAFT_354531 [Cyathus striatus]|nr:hypothetical protein BDQ17DRAFT_354531 [Cyathus striatus]